jgi:pyruvate/2-oxoglutarate/acetoin dehydrogenase E1 component
MDFPMFHLDWLNNRMLIAIIAILHVIINHGLAVGFMPFVTWLEQRGVSRSSKDQITDLEWDPMVYKIMKVALAAAAELEKEGISAEVIDLRTVRPIDYDTVIASVKKTNRLVIVEEAWPLASISSEITFRVQKDAFDYLDAPIRRITAADVPLPYAPTLIEASLPNVARTVKAVKEVMYATK